MVRRLLITAIMLFWPACAMAATDFDTVWTRSFGLAHYISELPSVLIQFDSDSNVVCAASTASEATGFDLLITKYNPDGDEVWTAAYGNDSLFESNDLLASMTVDPQGNLIIAGVSDSEYVERKALIAKLGADGAFLWARQFDVQNSWYDTPADLAVDAYGNIVMVVAGSCSWCTVKYAPDGTLLWQRCLEGGGCGWETDFPSVESDASGDIYVAARNGTASELLKYNPAGDTLWHVLVDSCEGERVLVLADGKVYLAGPYYWWPIGVATITQFDTTGAFQWRIVYLDSTITVTQGSWCEPKDIGIAGNGSIVLSFEQGELIGQNSEQVDFATLSLNNQGDVLWNRRYVGGSAFGGAGGPTGLDASQTGLALVTGGTPQQRVLTLAYGAEGELVASEYIDSARWYDSRSVLARDPYSFYVAYPTFEEVRLAKYLACCPCLTDPSCDGTRSDVVDVVTIIDAAFRGGAEPKTSLCPFTDTDVDCSASTDVVDVVKVVGVAFRGDDPSVSFCLTPCGD